MPKPKTAKYLKTMLEKKVDGIVLVGSIFNTLSKKDEIGNMIKNTPVVLANGKLELPNSYSVLVDDRYGCKFLILGNQFFNRFDSSTDTSVRIDHILLRVTNSVTFQCFYKPFTF